MSKFRRNIPANVIWFEIPVEIPLRAMEFYRELFGWRISPFPRVSDYWRIETGGSADMPDGGLVTRRLIDLAPLNYIRVPSVTKGLALVQKLGGKVYLRKITVRNMGCFALCKDTEGNLFGIWQVDRKTRMKNRPLKLTATGVSPRKVTAANARRKMHPSRRR